MVRNHAKGKNGGKGKMIINYKKHNDKLSLIVIRFLITQLFYVEFKKPFGSRKWITKVDVGR